MSRRGLWVTMKFRSVFDVVHASRFQSTYGRFARKSTIIISASKPRNGYYLMNPGLKLFTTNSNNSTDAKRVKDVKVQLKGPAFPYWLRWVLSSVLYLLLPFWKHDHERLHRIQGEAEFVIEEVEKVANVVEKVAVMAEKISEEVAEKLPEDGKLKKAALVVERLSKEAVHDAQLTVEFIHKVDEFKNGLDDLESFIEPIINKTLKKESDKK